MQRRRCRVRGSEEGGVGHMEARWERLRGVRVDVVASSQKCLECLVHVMLGVVVEVRIPRSAV